VLVPADQPTSRQDKTRQDKGKEKRVKERKTRAKNAPFQFRVDRPAITVYLNVYFDVTTRGGSRVPIRVSTQPNQKQKKKKKKKRQSSATSLIVNHPATSATHSDTRAEQRNQTHLPRSHLAYKPLTDTQRRTILCET
jgi:hypothetical protein